ncbi:MAG: transposase [Planctomycetes bacterium]|nr:transposase [Planctomycetota bacterium]
MGLSPSRLHTRGSLFAQGNGFCDLSQAADLPGRGNFLDRTIERNGGRPKYIVCDKGTQFWCDDFKDWCKRRNIKPRFGAIGRHGSIAVVERFIRSVKDEMTRVTVVKARRQEFRQELFCYFRWYNVYRPHSTLAGRTPDEVFHGRRAANRSPRFEPRPDWPRGSPCAAPRTLIKGQPGVRLELHVDFLDGREHLPIVTVRRAA